MERLDMDRRQVKEDSSVSGLRKRDKEGSSGTNAPEVPQEGRVERDKVGMYNIFSASVLGLKQLAFHFAPVQLMEQTPSGLYLAVFHIAGTPDSGKVQFLAERQLVEAQVTVPLTPCPQQCPFFKFYFPNSSFPPFPLTLLSVLIPRGPVVSGPGLLSFRQVSSQTSLQGLGTCQQVLYRCL